MTEEKEDPSCPCPADNSENLNFEHSRIKNDRDLAAFLDEVDDRVEDISTSYKEALWRMYVGEENTDLSALEERLLTITTSRNLLEFMKHWRPLTEDPICQRRLDVWRHELEKTQVEFDHRIHTAYQSYARMTGEFRYDVSGISHSLDDLNSRLAHDPDGRIRTDCQHGLTVFSAKADPLLVDLIRARNESAVNFGYANYADLGLSYLDVDWNVAQSWFDDYRVSTEKAFTQLRHEVAEELSLTTWSQSDLAWISNALYDPSWDTAVPFAVSAEGLLRRLAVMGADLDRLAISTREAPTGVPALTIPINIPSDIRILIPHADGFRHATLLAREYGRALYYASVDQGCYALRGVNEILLEASAGTFGDIVSKGEFWKGHPSIVESALAFSRYMDRNALFENRIFMALAEFEVRTYTESHHPDGLWSEIVFRYLGYENVDADWAVQNVLVNRPFYALQVALSKILAAGIELRMKSIPDEGRVEFLAQTIYRHGNRVPWRDIAADIQLGGSNDSDAL